MPDDDASHGDAALDEAGLDAHHGAPGDVDGAAASGPGVPDASDASVSASTPVTDGGASGDATAADGSFDGGPDAAACGSPSGTYATSCTQCALSGGLLTCECDTGAGASAPSSLDLCTCPDTTTISNAHGALTCCGNPGGTYARTCNECAIMGTVLGCTCETDNGGYVSSFIELCTCQPPSLIANTNGVLTCQ
jgi:hypothetical protein